MIRPTVVGAPSSFPSVGLDGAWRAAVADEELRRRFIDDTFDDSNWSPIPVPGHWRSTSEFAQSDGSLLYRTRFAQPAPPDDRRVFVTFDGIFYQGDVWLDGDYLGDTEGYFFPHTFEITEALHLRDEHVLAVEVACWPQDDRAKKRNLTGVFQHWDCIDPASNPGGIWQPVRIEETGPVRIRHFRARCVEAAADVAVVALRAVLDTDVAGAATLTTQVAGVTHLESRRLAAGENRLEWKVTVADPARWWPRALGDQPLHDLRVAVALDGAPTSDERTVRIGFRTVEMDDWIVAVNGERLFLKGANYGPTRAALGEATRDDVRGDVAAAAEAGLDLLRVHGHVGHPELYAAADEAGMLVWQDFPMQWGYARTVRAQARRQAREMVDLLAHHPSVAIWCAHNEPMALDVGPDVWEDPAAERRLAVRGALAQLLPTWNKSVLDGSVKRVLEHTDGTRPVVAHSGVFPHLPQLDGTDTHLYFGWYHGSERELPVLLRRWPRLARFVSEFGAQAVPDSCAFMAPERWPHLDWDHLRQHHGLQRAIFDRYVPPDAYATFDEWRLATQRYQARLVRRHVEELRRLKYRPTGGFCQFLFADAQDAVSWSVLDAERRPKLAYTALTEACRPVIVVADRLPAHLHPGDALALDVHVVSDLRVPVGAARVTARLSWPGGAEERVWIGDVPADSCVRVGTLGLVAPDADGEITLDLFLEADGTEATNHDATTVHAGDHSH